MINQNSKLRTSRKGSVLAFIIIIFFVVSILITSILHLVNTNIMQAKRQQDRLEAYYLAYSGIEMAFASLLADGNQNLYKLKTNIDLILSEENIELGNGKVTVISKITDNENFTDWIEITSTGTLDKNNLSYTRTLLFDPNNPLDMIWQDL